MPERSEARTASQVIRTVMRGTIIIFSLIYNAAEIYVEGKWTRDFINSADFFTDNYDSTVSPSRSGFEFTMRR
jgi:hypothetical protein